MDKTEVKKLYRYERQYLYTAYDEGENPELKIALREYIVTKTTPRGFRILQRWPREKGKFCLAGTGARFAHEKKEWAWQSFKIRTRRSLMYSKAAVKNAERFMELIKNREEL